MVPGERARSARWSPASTGGLQSSPSGNRSAPGPPRPRSPPGPNRVPRPSVPAGARSRSATLPGPVDGCQGLLQGRADRRRRRRGGRLCATYTRSRHPPRTSRRNQCASTSSRSGMYLDVPLGDLAHWTHLCGAGTYDPVTGERKRVTRHAGDRDPRGHGQRRNLEYLAPATMDPSALGREPQTFVVPDAGRTSPGWGRTSRRSQPQPATSQPTTGDTSEGERSMLYGWPLMENSGYGITSRAGRPAAGS